MEGLIQIRVILFIEVFIYVEVPEDKLKLMNTVTEIKKEKQNK